jgi:hypothetical protein
MDRRNKTENLNLRLAGRIVDALVMMPKRVRGADKLLTSNKFATSVSIIRSRDCNANSAKVNPSPFRPLSLPLGVLL